MNIEADALRHDDLKQVSVFTGRVVMTKGTIVVRGARLEVSQDPDGYQFGVVTGEGGKRAFFRQKRDTPPGTPDEYIEGEGETIDYNGRADNVRFTRRSELRRYRGGTLSDEISGDVIVYDNVTDIFTVDGRRATTGAGAPAPAGRVRATLTPKEVPAATAPAPSGVPTAPLRPSSTMREEPK